MRTTGLVPDAERPAGHSRVVVGDACTWLVPSHSQADTEYTVTWYPDGRWECDCPAFRFHSRLDGECKHVDEVRARVMPEVPSLSEVALCW